MFRLGAWMGIRPGRFCLAVCEGTSKQTTSRKLEAPLEGTGRKLEVKTGRKLRISSQKIWTKLPGNLAQTLSIYIYIYKKNKGLEGPVENIS